MTFAAALIVATAVSASDDHFLVIHEGDTLVYEVTDTIPIMIGESLVIEARIFEDEALVDPARLWVHNVSWEFVTFQGPLGRDRFSADPIRVTATTPGLASIMVHRDGGVTWLHLHVVERNEPGPRPTDRHVSARSTSSSYGYDEREPPARLGPHGHRTHERLCLPPRHVRSFLRVARSASGAGAGRAHRARGGLRPV